MRTLEFLCGKKVLRLRVPADSPVYETRFPLGPCCAPVAAED
jgi:hypothetical protein